MESLISSVTDWLSAHSLIAYLAVFLLAFSESIPLIGVVVPGTAVILALGALVPSGVVKLWPLLISATAGAIVGDGLSFWLGHRYHRAILGRWPLNRYPELIERSEAFFKKHGDKSVFIARFVPGVRAFVPLLAGMLGLPVWRFYAVNVASALVWAPAHILPAVLFGASFRALGKAAKPVAILLVIVIATGWVVWRLVGWAVRRAVPLLGAAIAHVRSWAEGRDSRFGRVVASLLDPERSEARIVALMLAALAGAATVFLGILEDVANSEPLVVADRAIYTALQDLRSPVTDTLMIGITELGDTKVVVAMTAIVFLWLAWERAWRTAAFWLVAVAGASALNTVIKVTLHRARPDELLYSGWSAFSFPSGHSTTNLVLYGFLTFLIARGLRPALQVPVALGGATLIVLIAFSRLYLGAHWFSDVVGGAAFGSAWLMLLGLFYLRRPAERIGSPSLLVAACAGLILAGGANIFQSHAVDVQRYAVREVKPEIVADWEATGWQTLPIWRVDLTGEEEEPLTVQWAGSLGALQAILQQQGWKSAADWSLTSAAIWLNSSSDAAALPVIPLFDSGRLPALTLVRLSEAPVTSRLVLRLWATDKELADATPLWTGSVVEERLLHPLSLGTFVSTQPDLNAPRQALVQALGGSLPLRADAPIDAEWDGRVLLARPQ
ncbi:bifunctional DedA family/phosphatase PAP2 family protein [Pleomorphomonas oryzae]|uniref:bifunctional DedA family/phosphatase PAP2 family protein n=1 Tax=Pleomorphomonas oryzae TaxID=261934 RepID=UPI00041FB30E|nr:bifunctional DedA family/phosphatase PAP2 family protein [Pleomorphomonas oryzae]